MCDSTKPQQDFAVHFEDTKIHKIGVYKAVFTPSGSSNASVYYYIDTKIPSQCKLIFDENKIRALDNHQDIEILI